MLQKASILERSVFCNSGDVVSHLHSEKSNQGRRGKATDRPFSRDSIAAFSSPACQLPGGPLPSGEDNREKPRLCLCWQLQDFLPPSQLIPPSERLLARGSAGIRSEHALSAPTFSGARCLHSSRTQPSLRPLPALLVDMIRGLWQAKPAGLHRAPLAPPQSDVWLALRTHSWGLQDRRRRLGRCPGQTSLQAACHTWSKH